MEVETKKFIEIIKMFNKCGNLDPSVAIKTVVERNLNEELLRVTTVANFNRLI